LEHISSAQSPTQPVLVQQRQSYTDEVNDHGSDERQDNLA
jgi:hypothetical protein